MVPFPTAGELVSSWPSEASDYLRSPVAGRISGVHFFADFDEAIPAHAVFHFESFGGLVGQGIEVDAGGQGVAETHLVPDPVEGDLAEHQVGQRHLGQLLRQRGSRSSHLARRSPIAHAYLVPIIPAPIVIRALPTRASSAITTRSHIVIRSDPMPRA